ncbi:hypothetical protein [Palleronia caenipelagi]|uniref:Peptidase S8/S53 domain-containing protein n=1 Tax=Palleronia caenipelagi TaxID=2489174 RepID=A0A547Q2W5_9RHOB|nr:hypothetical protein [Palleronia caenipelagi]TRD20701.1 hypothetical protein FEV53_09655 [Palleronia caenipelagi]
MAVNRPDEERIERYAGPYERWVFSPELGRPWAFPAIREGKSHYYTATLDADGVMPVSSDKVTVRVPPLYPGGAPRIVPFAFHAPKGVDKVDRIEGDREVAQLLAAVQEAEPDSAARFTVNFPVDQSAWTPDYRTDAPDSTARTRSTPPKAIVGVIDDGLPFAHPAYLDADGRTRVSHVWLQAAEARATAAVPFGREFTNDQIDALRQTHGTDTMALYREARAIDPERFEIGMTLCHPITHGSHIMGLAAGNGTGLPLDTVPDDVEIVAVQLPNTIAWDTSGFGKEMFMLSALHYVFERAGQIAQAHGLAPNALPLIVNFSYGWGASRHDGHSDMDVGIEDLISARGHATTQVLLPMGNTFENKMHGRIEPDDVTDGRFSFDWALPPGDRTSSYLEIWFPEGFDPDGWEVHLTPPLTLFDAPAILEMRADPSQKGGDPRRFVDPTIGGAHVAQLSADQNRGSRWRAMVAVIPTDYCKNEARHAPTGHWRVDLHQNAGAPLPAGEAIRVWVQRDDDPVELGSGGRQSWLVADPEQPATSGELGFVRGYGSYNGISSAPSITRVAGRQRLTGDPAKYSSAGSVVENAGTYSTDGAQPVLSVITEDGDILQGIASIGVLGGSYGRLSGTSAGSAAAARAVALNMASGQDPYHGFADAEAHRPADQPQALWHARMGEKLVPTTGG